MSLKVTCEHFLEQIRIYHFIRKQRQEMDLLESKEERAGPNDEE